MSAAHLGGPGLQGPVPDVGERRAALGSGGGVFLAATTRTLLPCVYDQLDKGLKVIARRWVVERTFAWWSFQRRLSRD